MDVSILTRPEGRVLHLGCYIVSDVITVSILTRPEGRVLPNSQAQDGERQFCFNPHPTRRPGATFYEGRSTLCASVSILTRPEGRVLHVGGSSAYDIAGFQSSPDPKAGCYRVLARRRSVSACFNPHPTRRPGATLDKGVNILNLESVSILTRPEGRVLQIPRWRTVMLLRFQSSPDPKAGCYSSPIRPAADLSGFNPHPTRRPGATQ